MFIPFPGSGWYVYPRLVNCIFWNNSAGSYAEIYNYSSNTVVSYSDVEGGINGSNCGPISLINGGGNINSDPKFRDANNADGYDDAFGTRDDGLQFSLTDNSSCIDRGDGDAASSRGAIGSKRFDESATNNGFGDPKYADIGAYEYIRPKISGGGNGSVGHTLVVGASSISNIGTTSACGSNNQGQLGNGGKENDKLTIVPVWNGEQWPTLSYRLEDIVSIDAGGLHSLAVSNNGSAWAWGGNAYGQLGVKQERHFFLWSDIPMQVHNLDDVVKVAASCGYHSLACDEDEYVWAWGDNEYGQLGNGNSGSDANEDEPVQVVKGEQQVGGDYLKYIVDIDAGESHSIALEDEPNGHVWCWGRNNYGAYGAGQLGNNSTNDSNTPVQVKGPGGIGDLNDMDAVCGGAYSSYALDANSTVWAWGGNGYGGTIYGQLGQGSDTNDHNTPVHVLSGAQGGYYLSNITAISAGQAHVLALDEDGGVWVWGKNLNGQLGDGTTTKRETPVKVKITDTPTTTYLTDIVYIDAGYNHSTAVDKYGRFWVWGANGSGQLGLGYFSPYKKYATEMPMP
jgi:alpha-tubulin suppressor-like RCC1 family protein